MNFYESYISHLQQLKEAIGDNPLQKQNAQPNGKQQNPAGSDPNPQGPNPQGETQQIIDPFELSFANFVLGLSRLKPQDQNIENFPIEQVELNLSKSGSNPVAVKKFMKQIVQRFIKMTGMSAAQLNYNDPKFGEKLGTSQQILGWANAIIDVIKNIKNTQSTSNIELKNYTKIDSTNIENFKKSLESLGSTK